MTTPSTGYRPPFTSLPPFDFGISNEMILQVAAICRSDGSVPVFPANAGPIPFMSEFFAYWPVEYPDSARVMVKVPFLLGSRWDNHVILHSMKMEGDCLNYLTRRGFRWSPRLLYSTLEFNNLLGRPYLIYTMLPGKRLEWSNTFPAEKTNREKVLAHVARIIFDLATLEQFNNPQRTAQQWVTAEIDAQLMRSIKSLDLQHGVTIVSCLALRFLARKLTAGKATSLTMVHAHEKLEPRNIFIDDDFNVTGLIEWGWVKIMPLRFAFRFPGFLTLNNRQVPPIPRIPENMCEASNVYFEVPAIMKTDREFFISRMQYEFATRATPFSVGHLSPKGWEMMCWDHENVDWSHLIFEALSSRVRHGWLAKRHFLVGCLPECASGNPQDVFKAEDMYREAWIFFLQHRSKINSTANKYETVTLLHQVTSRRMPWPFLEMMLIDAFGYPRP